MQPDGKYYQLFHRHLGHLISSNDKNPRIYRILLLHERKVHFKRRLYGRPLNWHWNLNIWMEML